MQALSRDREGRFPTARALGEAVAQAVAALGGPMTSSAIGDEMHTAFGPALTEQAALIRIARSGRALPLDADRGPMVGHGAELLTTPVSNQISPAPTNVSIYVDHGAPMLPPAPRERSSAGRIAIATVSALVVGAIAFAIYWWTRERKEEPERIVATPERIGEPIDASVALHTDAAAAPVDAMVVVTRPDTRPPRPPKDPAKKPASGPPGFITIDSAPVYAVIFIDGKRYGETPLVKLSLPPGRHTVRAVSPSGATRTVSITIESGKVAPPRRISW
jgi:serine/threonine-protein kinase